MQVCEHYISHGLCTDFPDWSIAAAGSEDVDAMCHGFVQWEEIPHVFLLSSTAVCLLSGRSCGMQCPRVAKLVPLSTPCSSATKSAAELRGSDTQPTPLLHRCQFQKERMQDSWRRANEAKRLKKQQLAETS